MEDEPQRDSVALQPIPRISENHRPPTYRSASSLTPDQPRKLQHPAELQRSKYGLVLAVIYATLVVTPWVILCILSCRPITTSKYYEYDPGHYADAAEVQAVYEKNERWYHAARVLQAIASIVTIPLTSAICASAAVIFMQRSQTLTMRQTMALADREWLDISGFFGLKVWKRYGSSFLYMAVLLNILGVVISPLQAIFLTSDAVKTPTADQEIDYLTDLTDPDTSFSSDKGQDGNMITILTRGALQFTTGKEPQTQLWTGANATCNPASDSYSSPRIHPDMSGPDWCRRPGATIENIASMPDPFLAELPAEYNTGLVRQFAPRINSTARYENITADEFLTGCDGVADGFFVRFADSTERGPQDYPNSWAVEACMPTNVTKSPWKVTRDRQAFSEILHLNITIMGYFSSSVYIRPPHARHNSGLLRTAKLHEWWRGWVLASPRP